MKFFMLLATFCLIAASGKAASEITLRPGSNITISAGDTMNIMCEGSSAGGTSGRVYCFCKPSYGLSYKLVLVDTYRNSETDLATHYNQQNCQTAQKDETICR